MNDTDLPLKYTFFEVKPMGPSVSMASCLRVRYKVSFSPSGTLAEKVLYYIGECYLTDLERELWNVHATHRKAQQPRCECCGQRINRGPFDDN